MKKNPKIDINKLLTKIINDEVENLPFIMEAMQPNDRATLLLKLLEYEKKYISDWNI